MWNTCHVDLGNKLHVFPDLILAIGLGLITTSLVSGNAYQLVCNSMEAHDLPSPVLVARMTLTLTVHFDNDFEASTLKGTT